MYKLTASRRLLISRTCGAKEHSRVNTVQHHGSRTGIPSVPWLRAIAPRQWQRFSRLTVASSSAVLPISLKMSDGDITELKTSWKLRTSAMSPSSVDDDDDEDNDESDEAAEGCMKARLASSELCMKRTRRLPERRSVKWCSNCNEAA